MFIAGRAQNTCEATEQAEEEQSFSSILRCKTEKRGNRIVALIQVENVRKKYQLGQTEVEALRGVNLSIEKGEFLSIWGPSGSGKSSLLNIIGMIDSPTQGVVRLDGTSINGLSDKEITKLRNQKIGFVFQSFNLVPVLSALENIMLPLQIRGEALKVAAEKAMHRLEEVGLSNLAKSRPDHMSGGQRQRIAIARALVTDPSIVLADEPTANLDSETSQNIIELMRELNERDQVTFIFSTHDQQLLDSVKRRIRIKDGQITAEQGEAE
ncbi:MAG: ABC transporter ATP-binding protein [Pseudomonadota bacterium]